MKESEKKINVIGDNDKIIDKVYNTNKLDDQTMNDFLNKNKIHDIKNVKHQIFSNVSLNAAIFFLLIMLTFIVVIFLMTKEKIMLYKPILLININFLIILILFINDFIK